MSHIFFGDNVNLYNSSQGFRYLSQGTKGAFPLVFQPADDRRAGIHLRSQLSLSHATLLSELGNFDSQSSFFESIVK